MYLDATWANFALMRNHEWSLKTKFKVAQNERGDIEHLKEKPRICRQFARRDASRKFTICVNEDDYDTDDEEESATMVYG